MLKRLLITMLFLAAPMASAMTQGQVYEASVSYARTTCAEPFAEHQSYWPPEDAEARVAWRNPSVASDLKDSLLEAPLPDVVFKMMSWNISTYALIEDFVRVNSFARYPAEPSVETFNRYSNFAGSLMASSDLYYCLRPSETEFEAFANIVRARNARTEAGQDIGFSDCLARTGKEMAGVFADAEAGNVIDALQPYRDAHEKCGSEN